MKGFNRLYAALDATGSTLAKVAAMADYFAAAAPADAAWAVYFLTGRRLKRLIGPMTLRRWASEATGLPDWLVEESYATVGDLAEAIALLVDTARAASPEGIDRSLSAWVTEHLLPLSGADEATQRAAVLGWWQALPADELFLLDKLLTGELRVGVSRKLVVRALAKHTGVGEARLMHRLTGHWDPTPAFWAALTAPADAGAEAPPSKPYPYFLATPLESDPAVALGERGEWQLEWKWDGIRGQLIRRRGQTWIWSRGEELVTERFPDVVEASQALPDGTVLDGELLAWQGEAPLPFAALQRRLNRKTVGAKLRAEVPVAFMAYDLIEDGGEDIRARPLKHRRARLEAILAPLAHPRFPLSPILDAADWPAAAAARESARDRGVEGLMLKRLDSPYRTGRPRGDWYKWKLDARSVDAVLIYAQPGHGRRATLLTDYTFGVWRGDELVPFAKAYSGLSDEEIATLDRWLRAHTQQKFGPVRQVEPVQVFEIAFEGIRRSTRHKSGVAVRFPRIARWRTDKPAAEADTLATVEAMIDEG